ncbi:MAG: hypothetical protein A3J55_01715 [Candidatus Ryanbacteria bacterium RIFCSPHIGHO2_02_FULL_45_17b]|uniref:Uncharacterized protein n=1 Tax=Candidatus Ryanbacteria bacterium RIFCSPHIGHO2_01_FULL_45_22 TaxID=1802114 RepID=A0A1G2G2T2_9BACT|nr:MAG: hypothetical protein A2719_04355 [Candidatus Ryanbacteria bacterium RIFCSPHIGHO2_01_FULL_45_22]OGZ47622.1 MAG: hypothetical protein A3J55_01715 [Candidatus Ryanbacteria bacterium RIFCSPHIGHO2_02_FULL_45_17b]
MNLSIRRQVQEAYRLSIAICLVALGLGSFGEIFSGGVGVLKYLILLAGGFLLLLLGSAVTLVVLRETIEDLKKD